MKPPTAGPPALERRVLPRACQAQLEQGAGCLGPGDIDGEGRRGRTGRDLATVEHRDLRPCLGQRVGGRRSDNTSPDHNHVRHKPSEPRSIDREQQCDAFIG